jgi:hypothetical protein
MKKLVPLAVISLCLASPAGLAAIANGAPKLVPIDFNSASSGELFLSVWDETAQKSYSLDLGVTAEQLLANPAGRTWALGQRFRDFAATGNPLKFNVAAANTFGTVNAPPAGLAPAGYGILTSVRDNPAEKAKADGRTGTSGTEIQQIASFIQGRVNNLNLNAVFQKYGGSPSGSAPMGDFTENLDEVTDGTRDVYRSYFNYLWGENIANKVPFSTTAAVRSGSGEDTLLLYFLGLEAPGSAKLLATNLSASGDRKLRLDPAAATLTWGEGGPVVGADCALPWGGTLASGQSITAYGSSQAVDCATVAETRTCTNGNLSGSAAYPTCAGLPVAAPCGLPWGGTLASGASVTAYRADVAVNCAAQAETRSCSAGQLSGSYRYAACAEPSGPFVQLLSLNNGERIKVRSRNTVQWDSRNLKRSPRLVAQFYKKAGARWLTVRDNLRRTGSFMWRPSGGQATTAGLLRICLKPVNRTGLCDATDQSFTVEK